MLQFILRRLLASIPVLLGISIITFVLVNVIPGDPVTAMLEKRADEETMARIRASLGLDRPLHEQYLSFLAGAIRGDLGKSYRTKIPVIETIKQRFPVTLRLASSAMAVALVTGLSIGILAAVKQYTLLDSGSTALALLGISAPLFWVAIVMQLVFGLKLRVLPISGYFGPEYMILPAVVLGSRYAASIARYTRSSMLEVIRQDYIRTARAKGLSEKVVVFKHAMKNAMIPVVTLVGLQIGGLLTGSILTETVFGIPGLGRLAIEAINYRDFPLIQGTVLFTAWIYVVANLIVDVSYAYLDPRIRLS